MYGSYNSREEYELAVLDKYRAKAASLSKEDILEAWGSDYGYPHRTRNLAKHWGLPHVSCSRIRKVLLEFVSEEELNEISEHIRQEKTNQTCVQRYGSRSALGRKVTQQVSTQARLKAAQTARQTNLRKYGVENVSQLQSVKDKKASTMEKNGTSFHFQQSGVMDSLQKAAWSESSRQKRATTNLQKYGTFVVGASPISQVKAQDTRRRRLSSYRKKIIPQVEAVLVRQGLTYLGDSLLSDLSASPDPYKIKLLVRHSCGTEYQAQFLSGTWNRLQVCPLCKKEFRSNREVYWQEQLVLLGYHPEHTRKLIPPYEVDIYIPEIATAIEFNGNYWHCTGSEQGVPKGYHQMKSQMCLDKGVKLYHIWEDTPESILFALFSKSKIRVFARKCSIKEGVPKAFFSRYHRHGYSPLGTKGLYLEYHGEIVAALELQNKVDYWDNTRYCVHPDFQIVGGFSKLISHAVSYYGIKKMITYCDRDLSPDPENTVYFRNGFELLGDVGLQMQYYVNGKVEGFSRGVYTRQTFQKHLIPKLFPEFEFREAETEQENLARLGIFPVYNSGTWKYVKEFD